MDKQKCFYKGEFQHNSLTGRGVMFYSETQDYYMGEFKDGLYHGKGLYYFHSKNTWELNEYDMGNLMKKIKAGEGRPQSLEISKEVIRDTNPFIEDIYIKPKDYFFEHYEVIPEKVII